MRSPTKISPKWCGFRSSCTTACAPRGNSGEGAAQKPLAAAQRARERGGAPRAGVDSAGSSGVQPLLEHTPHDPPPLARKRAAYSTRTAPTGCHRAQPARATRQNPATARRHARLAPAPRRRQAARWRARRSRSGRTYLVGVQRHVVAAVVRLAVRLDDLPRQPSSPGRRTTPGMPPGKGGGAQPH